MQLDLDRVRWYTITPARRGTLTHNHVADQVDDRSVITRCGQVLRHASVGRVPGQDCRHCLRLVEEDLEGLQWAR